jgi:shikimate kinase
MRACLALGWPLYSSCPVGFQRPVNGLGGQSPLISQAPMAGSSLSKISPAPLDERPIVLVGMMGAGKTAVGRRLARALSWPFKDADAAIEAAAGTSIANIFAEIGEPAFRARERQVIARLLNGERMVLALGGGAFMDPQTRALVHERARSIWLRADLDVLVRRTARPGKRPLLARGDPREVLADLLEQRTPIYTQADLIVDSGRAPVSAVVGEVLAALAGERVGAAP